MSIGMKPYDFVQQVYYAQEKVLLDFVPSDDKYREVLVEANLVLQELQNVEDWTWLRDKLVLGPCHHLPGSIVEFQLPDWVYKLSACNHDCIRLMKPHRLPHALHAPVPWFIPYDGMFLDQRSYIDVPLASAGDNQYCRERDVTSSGAIHWPEGSLRAIRIGDTLTFNRPLTHFEQGLVATVDVQRRIPLIHVCDGTCTTEDGGPFDYDIDENHDYGNPCSKVERLILTDIPDPNYVVMATAARHAEGSPPALARVAGLQDAAQRILSAMRSNDADATDSDYQDWDIPGFVLPF